MTEARVGKGIECRITNRGTPVELAEDVGNIVNGIYTGFLLAGNATGAAFFRTCLCMALDDRESPIWKMNKSAQGVSMTVPKHKTPPRRVRWALCLKGV